MYQLSHLEILDQLSKVGSKVQYAQLSLKRVAYYCKIRQSSGSIWAETTKTYKSIVYNNIIEAGLTSPFQRNIIYDEYLNDPKSNFIEKINAEIGLSVGGQSQIKKQSSDNDSKELIKFLVNEEQEQIKRKEKERKQQEDESMIEALKLQQQFSAENRIQREEKDIKLKQCEICLEESNYEEIWPLSSCGHIFHRVCLNSYFNAKIQERQMVILCPKAECKLEIQYDDLCEALDEENIQKFEEYALNNFIDTHAKDMSWCPTADCTFAFIFEQGDSEFNCPKCHKVYCLNCRIVFHKGQSCKEYQISNNFDDKDRKFLEFVKGQKWKQCPQCQFWVERNQGCDHMVCRCRYEFCYKCGDKYGNCECNKAPQLVVVPHVNRRRLFRRGP